MSDYYENIKKSALLAVSEPDDAAFMRKIARWFSKTFNTPLNDVEDLPKEYILQHYYEETFDAMEDEEVHNQIVYALESPEQRKERELKEKSGEDEFIKELEAEAKGQQDKLVESKKKAKALEKKSLKKPEPEPEEIKISYSEEIDTDADFIPRKK